MAKNIEINYKNEGGYEVLYPNILTNNVLLNEQIIQDYELQEGSRLNDTLEDILNRLNNNKNDIINKTELITYRGNGSGAYTLVFSKTPKFLFLKRHDQNQIGFSAYNSSSIVNYSQADMRIANITWRQNGCVISGKSSYLLNDNGVEYIGFSVF